MSRNGQLTLIIIIAIFVYFACVAVPSVGSAYVSPISPPPTPGIYECPPMKWCTSGEGVQAVCALIEDDWVPIEHLGSTWQGILWYCWEQLGEPGEQIEKMEEQPQVEKEEQPVMILPVTGALCPTPPNAVVVNELEVKPWPEALRVIAWFIASTIVLLVLTVWWRIFIIAMENR